MKLFNTSSHLDSNVPYKSLQILVWKSNWV